VTPPAKPATPAAEAEPAPETGPRPDDPPYEQARDELVEVVRRLETGGVPLDESIALWERGEALAAICQRRLDGVRARLERDADES